MYIVTIQVYKQTSGNGI